MTERHFTNDPPGQLTLRFDQGYAEAYPSLVAFVGYRIHHQGKQQKSVAADMDLSPSMLSRKVAVKTPDCTDTAALTCADLEAFIETQGDVTPIYYLIEKYLVGPSLSEVDVLKKRIAELEANAAASETAKPRRLGGGTV